MALVSFVIIAEVIPQQQFNPKVDSPEPDIASASRSTVREESSNPHKTNRHRLLLFLRSGERIEIISSISKPCVILPSISRFWIDLFSANER